MDTTVAFLLLSEYISIVHLHYFAQFFGPTTDGQLKAYLSGNITDSDIIKESQEIKPGLDLWMHDFNTIAMHNELSITLVISNI